MNSNLLNFYHSHKYLDLSKNLFQKILIQNCKKFPIRVINAKSKSDLESQSEIIKLVDQLLALNKEVLSVSLESKQNQLQNKIDYCENRINQLVYQLYELTEDDVKIIEGK